MNSPLDQYFEEFGTQLQHAADTTPQRDRRRAMWSATVVAACAAIAVAVLLISGGSSTKPVDAIAAARQAVTPSPGEIVYMRVTSLPPLGSPESARLKRTTEQWTAADPTRWRFVVRDGGQVGGRVELDYRDGQQSYYDAARNRMLVTHGLSTGGTAAHPPSVFGADPQQTLPMLLQAGSIQDLGTVQSNGRTVRRFRRTETHGRIRDVFIYDVDPNTFAPVAGESRAWIRHKGSNAELLVQYRFVVHAYRRIPITAQTEGLLRIQPPAGTRVIHYQVKKHGRGQTRIGTCVTRIPGRICHPETSH